MACGAGLLGAVLLTVTPTSWSSKCSWSYCGRALGVGLTLSPFPVSSPDCRAFHLCANEYPLTAAQHEELMRQLRSQDCPEP